MRFRTSRPREFAFIYAGAIMRGPGHHLRDVPPADTVDIAFASRANGNLLRGTIAAPCPWNGLCLR